RLRVPRSMSLTGRSLVSPQADNAFYSAESRGSLILDTKDTAEFNSAALTLEAAIERLRTQLLSQGYTEISSTGTNPPTQPGETVFLTAEDGTLLTDEEGTYLTVELLSQPRSPASTNSQKSVSATIQKPASIPTRKNGKMVNAGSSPA